MSNKILYDLVVIIKDRVDNLVYKWINNHINDRAMVQELNDLRRDLAHATQLAAAQSVELQEVKVALAAATKKINV